MLLHTALFLILLKSGVICCRSSVLTTPSVVENLPLKLPTLGEFLGNPHSEIAFTKVWGFCAILQKFTIAASPRCAKFSPKLGVWADTHLKLRPWESNFWLFCLWQLSCLGLVSKTDGGLNCRRLNMCYAFLRKKQLNQSCFSPQVLLSTANLLIPHIIDKSTRLSSYDVSKPYNPVLSKMGY